MLFIKHDKSRLVLNVRRRRWEFAVRRGYDQIRVPSIAAMLSALLALATVHQTYSAASRGRLIFPTASAPKPFKLAPSLRRSHADVDYVQGGSSGKNRAGKIGSADGSGGERCEMSPEEFAK